MFERSQPASQLARSGAGHPTGGCRSSRRSNLSARNLLRNLLALALIATVGVEG